MEKRCCAASPPIFLSLIHILMRGLEKEGVIGKMHETFYTTVGTGASLLNGEAFGRGIAGALKEAGVDAAIMVST